MRQPVDRLRGPQPHQKGVCETQAIGACVALDSSSRPPRQTHGPCTAATPRVTNPTSPPTEMTATEWASEKPFSATVSNNSRREGAQARPSHELLKEISFHICFKTSRFINPRCVP